MRPEKAGPLHLGLLGNKDFLLFSNFNVKSLEGCTQGIMPSYFHIETSLGPLWAQVEHKKL